MFIPTPGFHRPVAIYPFNSLLGIIALGSLMFTAASCSDHRKGPDPVVKSAAAQASPAAAIPVASADTVAAEEPSDAFAAASSTLEKVTRGRVSTLTPLPAAINRSIDARIAAWKAKGGDSTALSESKLDLARTDFSQKIQTLSLAGVETWESARTEATASLEKLRRACESVLAGKREP